MVHVNGLPHDRVLANFPPKRTHITYILQYFIGIKPKEYVSSDIGWKLKPVWF